MKSLILLAFAAVCVVSLFVKADQVKTVIFNINQCNIVMFCYRVILTFSNLPQIKLF